MALTLVSLLMTLIKHLFYGLFQILALFKISSGGGNKPIIWIDGGIHAREWISPASTMYLVREVCICIQRLI